MVLATQKVLDSIDEEKRHLRLARAGLVAQEVETCKAAYAEKMHGLTYFQIGQIHGVTSVMAEKMVHGYQFMVQHGLALVD
ncbi:hypothetical protein [Photobacterium leiognathi]|uniref:hypothetical protein n=1 Tax=Photobacterium leiognathi TaxID=553611 RepID=UPI0029823D79|nr:hypothetical protein [Photobacterium leiognathi]